MTPAEQIENGDISIFCLHTQTSNDDRRTLLKLQTIIRNEYSSYNYLEVGSHLGGSMLPHVLDPRCGRIISIDARPASQPDERGRSYDYENNSSARMMAVLGQVANAGSLSKIAIYDMDAAQVPAISIGRTNHLAFIDAEHTNQAVFRDFLSIGHMMNANSIVAFHDSDLVFDGLINIMAMLGHLNRRYKAFWLPEHVFAIALGNMAEDRLTGHLEVYKYGQDAFVQDARRRLNVEIAKNLVTRS